MKANLHKRSNVTNNTAYKKTLAFGLILCSVVISSCWYNHQWEDMHKKTGASTSGCSDTLGVTISYSVHIAPLITTYCSVNSPSCHKAGSSLGGDLTTHPNVAQWCSGSPSYMMADLDQSGNPMPKGMSKIPDCEIAKMAKWIQEGAPNN